MKMQSKMLTMSLFPLIILGLTTIIFGNARIKEVVTNNIENGLRGTAVAVRDAIDYADEGEYHVEDGTLYKGEFDVTNVTDMADHIQTSADTDITVFYGNIRYMTSILDAQGNRAIGTTASEEVARKVLDGQQEYFSSDANVNGAAYFGYYIPIIENGNSVGMVFAGMPQADAKAQINKIISLIAGIMVLFVFLFSASTLLVVKSMAKGLIRGASALEQVATGKLNVELNSKFAERKDEIGQISRAVQKLKQELTSVITEIMGNSKELHESSELLHEKTNASMEHINQIERAVDEIAQGAGSQAQETQSATEHVIAMGNMIEDTSKEITTLNENAKQIKTLGQDAVTTIEELQKINHKTRESIDVIYDQTNTTNTSAQRIKEATALITEIAEETNLLSLNASIEAARAGEQGRGFAVVAQEIGNLAANSSETAEHIQEICAEINTNIDNVRACFDDIIQFMEQDVSDKFREFVAIANEYDNSVEQIRQAIYEIDESSNGFLSSIESIQDQMNVIRATSADNESGVDDIVRVIEQTNTTTEELKTVVIANENNVEAINRLVKKFK